MPPSREKVYRLLLILLLIGMALCPLCTWQPSYFSSGISYRLTLETDAPLRNAKFLIPLPDRDGIPAVGFLNLTPSMFDQPGFNASFVSWEGNDYLRLTADTVDTMPYGEYQVNYVDRSERIDYDKLGYKIEYKNAADYPHWINTREPLGSETVFLPKYNVSIIEPTPRTYNPGSGIYFNPVLNRYQTKIYAEFESQNETSVHIYARLEGYNEWSEEFDAWRGNSYSDDIHASFFRATYYPSPDGWYLADGEMESGSGKYLDGTY